MSTTILAPYAVTKKREQMSEFGAMNIPAGGVVKLWEGYVGRIVRCLSGAAWITQEGDTRDYVLDPGEEMRIEREGTVVIQGLGTTRVTFR